MDSPLFSLWSVTALITPFILFLASPGLSKGCKPNRPEAAGGQ
jgi:hypothetical protein